VGSAQHASKDAELNRAMDDLSRLRDQIAGLGGRPNSQTRQGQPGRAGQPGGQQLQPGQLTRNAELTRGGQAGQPGQQQAQNGQSGQQGQQGGQGRGQSGQGQGGGQQQGGQAGGGGQAGPAGNRDAGPIGNRLAGPVGNTAGGGNRDGNRFGAYDTGNTRISGQAVAPQQGPNPADTQSQIDQGLNLLNQVRAVVQDSPEARQQLQSLIDQMRKLDPSRFPGNPALVEQMRQQLVSNVDALELQLRRQLDEKQGATIRNTDPAKVPAGYRDSVAEYYRKLSSVGH
jgi:hypothetical protein